MSALGAITRYTLGALAPAARRGAAARDELTSFYLTDFLVRQFDAFVWKPLGLDRHIQALFRF